MKSYIDFINEQARRSDGGADIVMRHSNIKGVEGVMMDLQNVKLKMAQRLEAANPGNTPASARGIPGASVDWSSVADIVVDTIAEILRDRDRSSQMTGGGPDAGE